MRKCSMSMSSNFHIITLNANTKEIFTLQALYDKLNNSCYRLNAKTKEISVHIDHIN